MHWWLSVMLVQVGGGWVGLWCLVASQPSWIDVSGFSERPYIKREGGEWPRKTPEASSMHFTPWRHTVTHTHTHTHIHAHRNIHTHKHMHTHIHKHTHTHTHTHTYMSIYSVIVIVRLFRLTEFARKDSCLDEFYNFFTYLICLYIWFTSLVWYRLFGWPSHIFRCFFFLCACTCMRAHVCGRMHRHGCVCVCAWKPT
jgi:hypothetical protein